LSEIESVNYILLQNVMRIYIIPVC